MPASDTSPLAGRVALVTGVTRRIGIGFGIAKRLLDDGARVFATGFSPHDAEMPWGEDAEGSERALATLGVGEDRLAFEPCDLEDPAAPRRIVERVIERFGTIDILVANHARSSHDSLAAVTAEELDRCWAANARSLVLLAQALGELRPPGPGGRMVTFCSAQHKGPMDGEIAYAVTKGAVHQMTASLANALIDRGFTVNCINPGPVDTGYAHGAQHAFVASMFPGGRWATPEVTARLVAWLVSDEAEWLTGQVVDYENGFRWRRGRRPAED